MYSYLDGFARTEGEKFEMLQALKPETATRMELGKSARRLAELESSQVALILTFDEEKITRIENACR